MCGIAGVYNLSSADPVDEAMIRSMTDLMAHRGPDGQGVHLPAPGVGLGHRRLAILDLRPESDQPFLSDDGHLALTFNGEIFNYIELRAELRALGHTFRTSGDTEVLLHAFEEWGDAAVSRLNGMWAFAIHDRRTGRLFCSRDRFGIKPFYWAQSRGRLLFASEAKALLKVDRSLAEPNFDALSLMLRASIVGQLEQHFFDRVRRLPPAHNLIVEDGRVRTARYWDYPTEVDFGQSEDAAAERLRELLIDSLRLRMRADVPVGTTLSGGVDSSTVASLLRTFYDGPHKTFTASYGGGPGDETELAGRLSRQLGMEHHPVSALPGDVLPLLEKIVWHMDAPTQCPATIPVYKIMESMRKEVVVALEGQGADELLGGYAEQAPAAILDAALRGDVVEAASSLRWQMHRLGPVRGSLTVARLAMPWLHRAFRSVRGDEAVYAGPLAGGPDRFADRADAPDMPGIFNDRLRHMHEGGLVTLLHYGDAMSMAHSVESRLPFMDYRLVEFGFRMPARHKVKRGYGKAVLRHAVRDDVPDWILHPRKKLGFVTPIARWFRESPEDIVNPVLRDPRCRQRGLFDPKALDSALDRHIAGDVDLGSQIFRWLTTELWFRAFIDGDAG